MWKGLREQTRAVAGRKTKLVDLKNERQEQRQGQGLFPNPKARKASPCTQGQDTGITDDSNCRWIAFCGYHTYADKWSNHTQYVKSCAHPTAVENIF